MAFSTKVGSFNIDSTKTVGQTQTVSGIGFTPKIVLFWWTGSTATSDSVSGGTVRAGFGAGISTTERANFSVVSIDAVATTDSARITRDDSAIAVWNDTAGFDGLAEIDSFADGSFTLLIDDQFSSNWRISYLALGGTDLTNVKIGQCAAYSGTGNYSTSGVGFQPDALILFSSFCATVNTPAVTAKHNIGFVTGASNLITVAGSSDDNAATSNTSAYGYNDECVAYLSTATTVSNRFDFVSFDTDGFTLNCIEYASNRPFMYVAFKGGQYSVGDITTKTDGTDIVETVGFSPKAILFASANMALSTVDTVTANERFSLGSATSTTERACAAFWDEDDLADSETAYGNYDSAVYANVYDDAVYGLMDLKSMDANGFTCVMDDTDPSACWVGYLAFGAASSGVTIAMDTAVITITKPSIAVSAPAPGSVNVVMHTKVLTLSPVPFAIVEGAVSKVMDTAVLAAGHPKLNVSAPVPGSGIVLDTALMALSSPDIRPIPALKVILDTAVLSFVKPDISITSLKYGPAFDTAVITTIEPDLSVSGGDVTLGMDTALISADATNMIMQEVLAVWHMNHGTRNDLTKIITMRQIKNAIENNDATIEEIKLAYAIDTGNIGIYTNGAWVWTTRWVYSNDPLWVGTQDTPLTSGSWSGNTFSTTAKTSINLSSVFGVPVGIKAVLAEIYCQDSGSSGDFDTLFAIAPNNTSGSYAITARVGGLVNYAVQHQNGICPCDANGNVYYQIHASGSSTLYAWIKIWAYAI